MAIYIYTSDAVKEHDNADFDYQCWSGSIMPKMRARIIRMK